MTTTQKSNTANWIASDLTSVPYSVYQDPETFRQEQEQIFRGPVWSYLALDAEIPKLGDFKSTYIGDTPVVVTRGADNQLHAWVNRCAHKGALVCRSPRGNVADGAFTCVYHQWAYTSAGDLAGVPYRRGLNGVGGMDKDFDLSKHGLRKLRVDQVGSMIFATFSDATPALREFLGAEQCANIERIIDRPIKVIGYARQHMAGNWKFYSENSRDSYHGALLHLFYPTFGIYRQSQESVGFMSEQGFHNTFNVMFPKEKIDYKTYGDEANRKMEGVEQLRDPRVLAFKPERDDNVALSIQSLFPSVVLQQIQNTLATRQVLPQKVDQTELVWTYFGYEDDDEEMDRHRIRNINLVGPAGFISMEDGEAVEMCQNGVVRDGDQSALIAMGGNSTDNVETMGMDENAVRGFWKGYRALMNV
ncbi:MAG: aromatic ring-hydroxylating dioxygenase subunit alpha [Porticoccaceae bacterium]